MLRACTGRFVTSLPSMKMRPVVGVIRPAIVRSKVVFPEPEGPSKVQKAPPWISKLVSFSPTCPLRKVRPTPSTVMLFAVAAVWPIDLAFRSAGSVRVSAGCESAIGNPHSGMSL
ncbi:hypothetical protein D3C84_798440 [compost metagenome]